MGILPARTVHVNEYYPGRALALNLAGGEISVAENRVCKAGSCRCVKGHDTPRMGFWSHESRTGLQRQLSFDLGQSTTALLQAAVTQHARLPPAYARRFRTFPSCMSKNTKFFTVLSAPDDPSLPLQQCAPCLTNRCIVLCVEQLPTCALGRLVSGTAWVCEQTRQGPGYAGKRRSRSVQGPHVTPPRSTIGTLVLWKTKSHHVLSQSW